MKINLEVPSWLTDNRWTHINDPNNLKESFKKGMYSVSSCELCEEDYSWEMQEAWFIPALSTDKLFIYRDGGCSCNYPYESIELKQPDCDLSDCLIDNDFNHYSESIRENIQTYNREITEFFEALEKNALEYELLI